MLDFPLHDGFFPPIVLSTQEVKYYRRLGKERVGQLVRIIEDAECAYKWTPCRPPPKLPPPYAAPGGSGGGGGSVAAGSHQRTPVVCQRAQFLDLQPTSKATRASTLLKASAQLADARPEEVLQALAKLPTRDLRKMMAYAHGGAFVDARTLFTLPSSSKRSPESRPPYSYRAIKWHALRAPHVPKAGGAAKHDKSASSTQIVDFCYLEYAGARRAPRPGSNVVGFIVQESITRAREVPSLARFGIARGTLSRVGIFVSRVAHQPATCRITALCQLDDLDNQLSAGGVDPAVLAVVMQRTLTSMVGQLAGLLERQRVSRLRFVEQWQWIPNAERKACAVCLRGFYFHRKHHCRTCGEVVCSSCAPLRELEEPIFDIAHLRVCSVCMLAAASTGIAVTATGRAASSGLGSTSTGDDDETYARGLRSPRHDSYEDMVFHLRGRRDRDVELEQERERVRGNDRARQSDAERKSDAVAPMPLPLRPQDKLQMLTNVVSRIRDIRDTIDMTISEVDASGAAADGDDLSDTSGGADDAQDLYSEMQSIRDALETSVSQFDAALASATGVGDDDEEEHSEDGRSAMKRGTSGSDQDDDGMTPDQFHSVARITLAAARATKQAGEAFLSSAHDARHQHRRHRRHAHERDSHERHRHTEHHRPRRQRREASDLLADLGGNHTGDTDSSGASSHSRNTNGGEDSVEGTEDPYADSNYEKLMRASRSPKDGEASHSHSEPDSHGAAPDGTLTDSSAGVSSSGSSSMRTSRDIKKMMTSTKSTKIRALEQQIRELQRCLEDAQRKLSVMESDDATPLELRKQPRQRQRQMNRPSTNEPQKLAAATDLVSELRGVMNSSEVTLANNNGRRSLSTKKPAPRKPSPQEPFANVSSALPSPIAVVPEEDAFDGMDTPPVVQRRKQYPPPPPPPPVQQPPKQTPNGHLDSAEKTNLLDKTASSSFGSALATEKADALKGKPAPAVDPQALGISDSGEWDDLSDSDDDDDDDDGSHSHSSSEPQFEQLIHPHDGRAEKDTKVGATFFEEEDLSALLQQRASVVGPADFGGGRPTLLAAGLPPDDFLDHEDESTELRELMAALARPRSNSLPFDTDASAFGMRGVANQHGGAPSQEITANAGAGGAAPPGGNPPLQPSWSDGSPERGPTAHHVDHAVRAIRACLASLRCECPSKADRRRRLAGVAQILKSLRRDGVRSRCRTLAHAELGYAQLLQRAPSVVKLLKLAGYVSLPQKLTMRRVDAEFLALVLRELERELAGRAAAPTATAA